MEDVSELIRNCELLITDTFMLNIPVTVVSAKELWDTLSHAPDWWDTDKEDINYAIFIIAPTAIEEVFKAVGEIEPEYERIAHYGNANTAKKLRLLIK